MSTTLVLQALITGLLLGGLYALVSSGLSIIMGVMNIVNFAHGEFLMLALYLAWGLAVFADFNVYATMLVTIPVLFLFGALVFKGTIERVLQKPILVQIILTLGLSMFLQGLATALFSADVRSVANPYSQMTLKFAGMFISVPYVIAFVGSCLAFIFLWWVLQKTEMGRSIRASAQNAGAAQLMGIDIRKTYLLAFGIGSALVGLAASLMIPFYYATPVSGFTLGLFAFFVIVLGGNGSLLGCFLGGLIIGVAESLGAALLPGSLSRVCVFAVFVAFLMFRPQGIMQRRTT